MEKLILNIKDSSKLSLLLKLINQLDFVEVESVKKEKGSTDHDFFSSAGLWAERDLNAKELRKQAWTRIK